LPLNSVAFRRHMDNKQHDKEAPAAKEKHSSRKTVRNIILVLISVVIVVFLLVGLLVCSISSQLLASSPVVYKPEALDMAAAASVQRKIMPIYQEMFRCKPEDPYQLILTDKEINVLLNNVQMMGKTFAGNQSRVNSQKFVWPDGLNVKYVDKCFRCEYSYKLPYSTPFGKYLNFSGLVIPEMKDGNVKFICNDVKAGKMDIPSGPVNQKIAEGLSRNRKNIAELTKVVSDFYIDDKGLLHVTIYPYALRIYVMEFMKQRMQQGAEAQLKSKKAASPIIQESR